MMRTRSISLQACIRGGRCRLRTLLTWPSTLLAAAAVVAFIVATGCNTSALAEREIAFAEHFPYDDVNRSLRLRALEGLTEASIGHIVTVQIENHSNEVIAFPVDYGVQGFTYDPNIAEWVELPNRAQFYPDVQRLLGVPGGTIPSVGWVDYEPELDTIPASLDIRIVVVGHVLSRDTHQVAEPVVAYIDLTLR